MNLREIGSSFLKLGATSYGGPAMMGVMQAELQRRRGWVSRERFTEGLSVVNMLPGATATQLAIFLGYARGGWLGGLLAGVAFVVPGFIVMLALTLGYASLGMSPLVRGALYGLGPVVIGIFAVAVYRLGRTAVVTAIQVVIAAAAAVAALWSPLGVATILVLAGLAGVLLFHSRRPRVLAVCAAVLVVLAAALWWTPARPAAGTATPPAATLVNIGLYFLEVGAFTVGGGLAMIAFIQQQVVEQFHWLSPGEFIDGLALGQLTPGPVLMVAAYVGYKAAGVAGAAVAAAAVFLPSFALMLAVLPVLDRVRRLAWMRAVLKGMGPAVIGVLAVSLLRLAPHALPDPLAVAMLVATVLVLARLGPLPAMLAGAAMGMLRVRLLGVPARAARAIVGAG